MLRSSLILAAAVLTADAAWSAQPAGREIEARQDARARLMEMSRFLAGTQKFSVVLHVGYEVLQPDGQKIEFGEARKISVLRPDRARIVALQSDGGSREMLFDSKQITVVDEDAGLYAQAPQPGDIDASVVYFVRDLQMRLPLAPLLMKNLPQELSRRVQSIQYVEHTDILGQPAHHVAARTASVDFQVWIADGPRPLPLRIVLTYPSEPGQPQFRANFSEWNLAPGFDQTTFAFEPAANAKRIMFSAQFVPVPATRRPGAAPELGDSR